MECYPAPILMRQFFSCLVVVLFMAALCSAQKALTPEMLKMIEASTPAALPQEPVVPKEQTDAQDEGLKGNVKTVAGESQDLSGTDYSEDRHLSYIEHYNIIGNFVKRISFDYKGNPDEVTVYGYINNARVSKDKSISYEYDPPPVMPPPGVVKKDTKQRDLRISYRWAYKYLDGKLSEEQMYYNDGRPGMRYTYTRTGNTFEKLAFDDKGILNQKYLFKLDQKGNAVEDMRVDLTPQKYYGDKKFVFTFDSFDKKGNWTKKTASEIKILNGKEVIKPSFINFRTITYYD